MLKRLVSRLFNSLHLIYIEKKKKKERIVLSPRQNSTQMKWNVIRMIFRRAYLLEVKVQLTTRISILAVFDTYIHWLPFHR